VDIDLKKVTGIFDLTNQNAVRVTQKDFPGKYRLVYFGYTSCPDMCPTGLQAMSRTMDMLGERAERVQPLFITVDPARDTQERLRDYLSAFNPAIMGLRGSEAQTEAAADAFQVDYEQVEDEEGTDAEYVVEHNSAIFLLAPEGKLLKAFPENVAPAKIVKALRTAWNMRD
jgi:protein SCO1/2